MRSFYLDLSEDDDLILTPYHAFDPEKDGPEPVELVSADLLEIPEEKACIETMKREASFAVVRWIQDKRYTARVVVTALIFLVTYFIGTLAIRDPIPMIDELLIAGAVSAAYWFWAIKHDETAQAALLKRDELFREIDSLTETQSQYVRDLEEHYESFRSHTVLEIAEMIAEGRVPRFEVYEDHKEMHEEFRKLLHALLRDTARKELKLIEDIMDGKLSGEKCVNTLGAMIKKARKSGGNRMSPFFIAFVISIL